MVKSEIRPATIEDALEVALNLCEADRNEIWASGMNLPIPCLLRAVKLSTSCYSLVIDGNVACVFGVAPVSILGNIGSPWMLGTDLIKKYPLVFLRKCQNVVLDMCDSYGTLINYVDSRNKLSKHWLSWVGFNVFDKPEPYGPFNMPFHRFELRK